MHKSVITEVTSQDIFNLDMRRIYLGNYVYWEANEHVRPRDPARWLGYARMTVDDFDEIADTFSDPLVWWRQDGEWRKDNVWD